MKEKNIYFFPWNFQKRGLEAALELGKRGFGW
jgi:hypothetical protein